MNTERENKKNFSLINFRAGITILGILAAIAAAITLPSCYLATRDNIIKNRMVEAKQTLAAMNKSQQAYFTENNRFMTTMADFAQNSGAGIKTQSVNYTYDVVAIDRSHVVNLAKPVQNSKLLAYVGGVGLVKVQGNVDKTSTTVLCQSIKPGVMPTANAIVFTATELKCNGKDFVDVR